MFMRVLMPVGRALRHAGKQQLRPQTSGADALPRYLLRPHACVAGCMQEDCDMAYFSLDITPIQAQAQKRGVQHVRFPVRDFDPFDLRWV